ncbi:MAG: hypothetical protein ACPGRC_10035 [Salibacteraceae bacterium]
MNKILNNTVLFLPFGVMGTAMLAVGALFKMLHYPGAAMTLQGGIILFFVFGIWTLAKVYFSEGSFTEKLLWMAGMILAPVIVMWVYHIKTKLI